MKNELKKKKRKFYWHANTSSGGTLSLSLTYEGQITKKEKENALARGISGCTKIMREKGFIPYNALIMSSSDLANHYGKTRQYWEKLLNEGKIHYKETSAGRITTDIWVQGYLTDKENVNKYVRDVKIVLQKIDSNNNSYGRTICPVCKEEKFEYAVNGDTNVNGICRKCGFHVHTTK